MFIVRETMHCKPGKVKPLVDKFKALSKIMEGMGYKGFRILTDVSGAPYWTMIAELEFESMNAFADSEAKVMANAEARAAMEGYHDLVVSGGREIFRLES